MPRSVRSTPVAASPSTGVTALRKKKESHMAKGKGKGGGKGGGKGK